MEYAYEIWTIDGMTVRYFSIDRERGDIEEELISELENSEYEWYRIRCHVCGNHIGVSCYPWEEVKVNGEIPSEDVINN